MLRETSTNRRSTIEQATVNSHLVKSHTFLQVIPVIISNDSRTGTNNVFLDSRSDVTLISKGLAEKSNLKRATKALKIHNVLGNKKSYESNLINSFISSKQNLKGISITNSWSVSGLQLPTSKLPIDQIKEIWYHFEDIELPQLSSSCENGVLIGVDISRIHL